MEQESNKTCPSKSFVQKAQQASNASCPQLLAGSKKFIDRKYHSPFNRSAKKCHERKLEEIGSFNLGDIDHF